LVLRTERLVLRPLAEADIDAVVVAGADPVTQRWLPLPRPYGRAHAEEFVRKWAPGQRESGDGIVRALGYGSELAGVIDLKRTDWVHRETEIGYWAAPGFRGLGLMTEAVAALARWVLGEQGFERAELRAATGNIASARVAVKAGFGYEGVARNAGVIHDGRVDLAIYSMIPGDLGQ
jgi:RimJ/RimL family protein N-acetyltransferase